MAGLRCLRALEFCVFHIETSLLIDVEEDGSRAGTTASKESVLEAALLSRETEVSALCAAAFSKLSHLKYIVVMGGSIMYGMRRGGALVRKPLLEEYSRWFPDIDSL